MKRFFNAYVVILLTAITALCVYLYLESRPKVYTASYLIQIGTYGSYEKTVPIRLASPKIAAEELDVYLFNDAIRNDECRNLGYENGMAMRNNFIAKSRNNDLELTTYGQNIDNKECVKKVVELLDARLRENIREVRSSIEYSIYRNKEKISKLDSLNKRIATMLPNNTIVATNLLAPIEVQKIAYEEIVENYELALSDEFNNVCKIVSSNDATLIKNPSAFTAMLVFIAIVSLIFAYLVLARRGTNS